MSWVIFLLVAIAYINCVWHQLHSTSNPSIALMDVMTEQLLIAAQNAVTLSFGLIGVLALFLGLIKIVEHSGLLEKISKLIYPLLKPLFPEIPANHPAFGAMVMNFSANLLGIGNAATPFGLKAMQELDKLNTTPGTASNAMVLFLAINTSSLTLLPTKVIALRSSAGSSDPAGIIATTLFATICSTAIAIVATKLLQRVYTQPPATRTAQQDNTHVAIPQSAPWLSYLTLFLFLLLVPVTLIWGTFFSAWVLPTLILAILFYGLLKKIDIYSSFVEGAKGGFEIAIYIIPYLVAILVAIAMFRASGAMDVFIQTIGWFTAKFGLPPDALPMALMRPLSGSGSLGILSDIFKDPALGPDSYVGYLASTMMGSTETTFYVLAVYFGAVQIKKIRHALAAGLIADFAGMVATVVAVKLILF